MARSPSVSKKGGFWSRANFAALKTKPSIVAVLEVGSWRFQSRWLSFQEGDRFSVHGVARWKAETFEVPSKLGFEASTGSPSNFCDGSPFACQYDASRPK